MVIDLKPQMKFKFLKAKYKKEFELPENFENEIKNTFKKGSTIALYAAIQFIEYIEKTRQILDNLGYKTITSKPSRTTKEGQILGCDSSKDSLKIDIKKVEGFIYLGDGYFHPNAILLAQENENEIKPVIAVNLPQKKTEILNKEHIEKYLKKKKANLAKFYMANTIGIYISSKWGQEQKKLAKEIEKSYKDKNTYYFIGDMFSEADMDNFPFVEVWVNTACPRIGQDDILRHKKPVVNIEDITNGNN
jgi:diphthamide biosynthesis enzyme Dph1/Dph2-like protein